MHFSDFESELDQVVKRAEEASVSKIITIGTDIKTSEQSIDIAKKFPDHVLAAVGIHPTDCLAATESEVQQLSKLAEDLSVVAIGEIGLDLYWKEVPLNKQWEVFRWMKELAEIKNLPMIIHTRDAYKEMKNFFSEYPPKRNQPGVLHSFDGSIEDARFFLDKGFFISFTGVVTFKNYKKEDLVKYVPVDRLLFETDAPFLSPHPKRGKRNEPMNIVYTAGKISEIKGIEPNILFSQVYNNSINLFKIDKSGKQ